MADLVRYKDPSRVPWQNPNGPLVRLQEPPKKGNNMPTPMPLGNPQDPQAAMIRQLLANPQNQQNSALGQANPFNQAMGQQMMPYQDQMMAPQPQQMQGLNNMLTTSPPAVGDMHGMMQP